MVSTLVATQPNGDGTSSASASASASNSNANGSGESSSTSSRPKAKLSKNQLRRLKNKEKKHDETATDEAGNHSAEPNADRSAVKVEEQEETHQGTGRSEENVHHDDNIPVNDVAEPDLSDPSLAEFAHIFSKFQADSSTSDDEVKDDGPAKAEVIYSDEEEDDEEDRERALANAKANNSKEKLSRKKRKQAAKLSVAELKTLVTKPEVVEWFDCDARDPRLLVELKSYRNTVPVPIHWSQKREYLSGKRGIEKAQFQLPAWIADTGIADQRDAIKEKESTMSLKQKTRERVQPKMGKIDIDYQKLHDAFFKFQTKPNMSTFGESYYEGKELETDLRMKKPGDLSEELREALSIPPLAPPPWLIAMQRYGPPPSYPNLRVPGLNAPIPEGAQWGFHAGGWGRPPVDEYNRPLYGDPFGVLGNQEAENQEQIDRELWGTLESEEEEEEESEEEEEEEEEGEDLLQADHQGADGMETPSGLETPGGMQSVVSTVAAGLETPDFMHLRKEARSESDFSQTPVPRELYQVIPERQTSATGFMGSSTAYDVAAVASAVVAGPSVLGGDDRSKKRKQNAVEIAVDPDSLEDLSQEDLRARYEAGRAANTKVYVPGADVDRAEFGEVIAKESAKRTKGGDRGGKDSRREKEKFKF